MDKVASLRAFVKVVETGSFTEAGRQLRLSRSAISKYVAELEHSLGVQLLNRTTRHASPNENGQMYFDRALAVLSELDAADEAVAQAQSTPAACSASMPRSPTVRSGWDPRSRSSWKSIPT
jgi:DNA-binding transcriptional LysR family regulator